MVRGTFDALMKLFTCSMLVIGYSPLYLKKWTVRSIVMHSSIMSSESYPSKYPVLKQYSSMPSHTSTLGIVSTEPKPR